MKKLRFVFVLLSFLLLNNLFSQSNTFFIGDKTYSCSSEYIVGVGKYELLECDLHGFKYEKLHLLFVKDGLKGMVVFKRENIRICGTILLYLDDNSVIKLLDKKKFDKVNDTYSSVYYLTSQEIEKLKTTNINTIRYNLCDEYNSEAKSVDNKDYECYQNTGTGKSTLKQVNKVNFPEIITNLFD